MSLRACIAYLEQLDCLLQARRRRRPDPLDDQIEAAFAVDMNDMRKAMTPTEGRALDEFLRINLEREQDTVSTVYIEPATLVCDECGCASEPNAASVTWRRNVGAKRIVLPPGWRIQIQRHGAIDDLKVQVVRFLCGHHGESIDEG